MVNELRIGELVSWDGEAVETAEHSGRAFITGLKPRCQWDDAPSLGNRGRGKLLRRFNLTAKAATFLTWRVMISLQLRLKRSPRKRLRRRRPNASRSRRG